MEMDCGEQYYLPLHNLANSKNNPFPIGAFFPEREKERSTIIDGSVSVAGAETHKLQNDVSRLALGSR